MWRGVVVGSVLLATTVAGCGFIFGRPAPTIDNRSGATQVGMASWYGPGFHGNPTSSGEIYDQYELTAAHQTLPLGTRVAANPSKCASTIAARS